MKKERIIFWDVLRTAAMVFLVIRHSSTATFEFLPLFGTNWWISNVYGSLAAWMVPAFMMISGASFLNLDRNISVKKLYKKNILHMLIVYFFWSAFYAFYNIIFGQNDGKGFFDMFWQGHFHLWFLPMIIGIYALVPLFRETVKNPSHVKWITAAAMLMGVIIPSFQDINLFPDNTLISGANTFGMISAYTAFFYMGHLLQNSEIKKPVRIFIYILGIAATIIVFYGTYKLSAIDGVHNEDIQSDNNIFTCIQGIAIFVWCKQYFSSRVLKEETKDCIVRLSGLTFGVYMVHVVFLAFLDRIGLSLINYSGAYLIPMYIGLVVPGSFIISYIIKAVPFLGKHLV